MSDGMACVDVSAVRAQTVNRQNDLKTFHCLWRFEFLMSYTLYYIVYQSACSVFMSCSPNPMV